MCGRGVGGGKYTKKALVTGAVAEQLNAEFRARLASPTAAACARFSLSPGTCDMLLSVIRGLCYEQRPITFAAAEATISAYIARTEEGEGARVSERSR